MSERNTPGDSHSQEMVVCPKCLLNNEATAAFCQECGAPIGMVATVDPIQQIQAEGFGYRAAVEGPPKLIIVIGVWLIFGPTLLAIPFIHWKDFGTNPLGSLVFLAIEAICGIIVYRTTRNYLVKTKASRVAGE